MKEIYRNIDIVYIIFMVSAILIIIAAFLLGNGDVFICGLIAVLAARGFKMDTEITMLKGEVELLKENIGALYEMRKDAGDNEYK